MCATTTRVILCVCVYVCVRVCRSVPWRREALYGGVAGAGAGAAVVVVVAKLALILGQRQNQR